MIEDKSSIPCADVAKFYGGTQRFGVGSATDSAFYQVFPLAHVDESMMRELDTVRGRVLKVF